VNERAVASIGVLGFLVVVIIGVAMSAVMIPVVFNTTNSTAIGATGGTATLIDTIPTIFILGTIIVGVAAVIIAVNR